MSLADDIAIMKRREWLVDYLTAEGGYTPQCEIVEAVMQTDLFDPTNMQSARVSMARLVRSLTAEGYIAAAEIGERLTGYGVTAKCHPLPTRYRDKTGKRQ